jgi:hypothetical protein
MARQVSALGVSQNSQGKFNEWCEHGVDEGAKAENADDNHEDESEHNPKSIKAPPHGVRSMSYGAISSAV